MSCTSIRENEAMNAGMRVEDSGNGEMRNEKVSAANNKIFFIPPPKIPPSPPPSVPPPPPPPPPPLKKEKEPEKDEQKPKYQRIEAPNEDIMGLDSLFGFSVKKLKQRSNTLNAKDIKKSAKGRAKSVSTKQNMKLCMKEKMKLGSSVDFVIKSKYNHMLKNSCKELLLNQKKVEQKKDAWRKDPRLVSIDQKLKDDIDNLTKMINDVQKENEGIEERINILKQAICDKTEEKQMLEIKIEKMYS